MPAWCTLATPASSPRVRLPQVVLRVGSQVVHFTATPEGNCNVLSVIDEGEHCGATFVARMAAKLHVKVRAASRPAGSRGGRPPRGRRQVAVLCGVAFSPARPLARRGGRAHPGTTRRCRPPRAPPPPGSPTQRLQPSSGGQGRRRAAVKA